MHDYCIIDEASDLEACQLLTANAENLTSAISEALDCTRSAYIRVAKETREELENVGEYSSTRMGGINLTLYTASYVANC